jgi:uncharacterized membrane protein YdjX (TVP38/TMEM64 family)
MRRWIWLIVFLLILAGGAGALLLNPEWWAAVRYMFRVETIGEVAEYLRGYGIWTPIISIMLMLLQAVIAPLPSTLIIGANGVLFGFWWGALLSWIGVLLGSSLAYWLARRLGRGFVARWFGEANLERVDRLGNEHGFLIILMARLVPLISVDFISYLAGVSTLSYLRFLLATAIGSIPGIFVYTTLGYDLGRAQTSVLNISLIILFFVVVFVAGRWWVRRQAKAESRKLKAES